MIRPELFIAALPFEQRAEIEGVFDSDRVGDRQRNRALNYLRESYEIINDPEQRNEEIVEACRGPANLSG